MGFIIEKFLLSGALQMYLKEHIRKSLIAMLNLSFSIINRKHKMSDTDREYSRRCISDLAKTRRGRRKIKNSSLLLDVYITLLEIR